MDKREGSDIFSCKALGNKGCRDLVHTDFRNYAFAICGRKQLRLNLRGTDVMGYVFRIF